MKKNPSCLYSEAINYQFAHQSSQYYEVEENDYMETGEMPKLHFWSKKKRGSMLDGFRYIKEVRSDEDGKPTQVYI
eukprot:CAMPEP_0168353096 /NCGR_PEP_ID=MMETSP0213-20121227/23025_1 /TAXON_ID=151035 /ORGANISM="Euplotes harpa, Strain FSP1.4" /LENGTH=75 /DNA_ID=CAMNT_0008364597 /DNA_START=53 /DNA_END=280 /DNA_ORIENTATION=+